MTSSIDMIYLKIPCVIRKINIQYLTELRPWGSHKTFSREEIKRPFSKRLQGNISRSSRTKLKENHPDSFEKQINASIKIL